MVFLRLLNEGLMATTKDNILYCDIESERVVEIPEPILPENLTKGQIEVLKREERTINSIAFSECGEYFAVSMENKQVVTYDKTFTVVKNFIVNRAASKICFTSNKDLIIADKTGDVYLYKLNSETEAPILLLGHLSVILDVVLSECEKYIITCDRDEKIRVSRFPNAYNIVSFCLGHKEFVTNLKIVQNILLSASGDGTIRFWNYCKGEQLGIINTNDYINDKSALESFAKEMDLEKVDISALPITDLKVIQNHNLLVAVTIYNFKGVHLFSTDLSTYKSIFLKTFEYDVYSYCLQNKHLLILTDTLLLFEYTNGSFVQKEICFLLNKFDKYKYLEISNSNSITAFYKRKFDNVQEYLDRKRQRLQLK